MKRVLTIVFSIFFLVVSCSPNNQIVEHPKPALSVDNSYFGNQGCYTEYLCLDDLFQDLDYRISSIDEPADILGGLEPSYPIAKISTFSFDKTLSLPSVYSGSCAAIFFHSYLVNVNGVNVIVDSVDKLKELYAPITSKNEALSYAVAVTGYAPKYDLESIENIRIYSDKLEETFVARIKGGYIVHLFDFNLCHCGPFVIKSVDVAVQKDGVFSVSVPLDAFSDPGMDMNCID